MSETKSLGDAIQDEIKRVRELVVQYNDPILNGAGRFASFMMEQSLDKAVKALAEGDVIEILRAYEDLKTYES